MGSLVHYSTDRTEAWHRPIKNAYNRSNRGPQAAEQILHDIDWDLAWGMWVHGLSEREKGRQELEVEVLQIGDTGEETAGKTVVLKTVKMKGSRLNGARAVEKVEKTLDLPGLAEETLYFLDWIQNGRQTTRKWKTNAVDGLDSIVITTYNSISLTYPMVHDPYKAIEEQAYSVSHYRYFQDVRWTKPRHDTVLIRWVTASEDRGEMGNRRVAQLLLLFKLQTDFRLDPYQLAFVQWLERTDHTRTQADPACGMYKLKKTKKFQVIEVETIERAVHLILAYGDTLSTVMAYGESSPALESYEFFWLNNQADEHVFNTIW